jgi:hypothetical protein
MAKSQQPVVMDKLSSSEKTPLETIKHTPINILFIVI